MLAHDVLSRSVEMAAFETSDQGSAAPRAPEDVTRTTPVEENVEAIKAWELETLHSRSRIEQISDWVAGTAASGPVLLAHVLCFAGWIVVNAGWVPPVRPFDPFPFPFLTISVALEAIFLALFVLASQNRLTRQSERRSHLNLQIDLLTEREMTAVLRLLRDIASHLDVKTSVTGEQLRELVKKTDVQKLSNRMSEFDGDAGPPA